jgi:uncharacterized protein with HEPN domain
MLTRMQYDILQVCGKNITVLLAEMQGENELFASANTLLQVEANLLAIAQTLAHLPDTLRLRLLQIDWHGWACLQSLLEQDAQPRRAEVWYGTQALAPATLELISVLRRQEPSWFEIGY